MARRLLVTLLVFGLAAAAWWILRSRETGDEGLVVEVHVLDRDGAPVAAAQVQAVYTPGWRKVGADGTLRLTNVLLRAEEDPSEEALRNAVKVRAPFYTQRRGFDPVVSELGERRWAMRFALHHHGVFRLALGETHLGSVKAWLEDDERWEAMDRGNVARPGAPAAYRVYPGEGALIVRIEGEPDEHGAIAAATTRIPFPPPAPGVVVEETVTAAEVKPILGTILPPADGPKPPSLQGRVRVRAVALGAPIDYGFVPVDRGGSFVVRRIGSGRYELTPECPYLAPFEPTRVDAGDVVELQASGVLPWLEVQHGSMNAREAGATFLYADGSTPPPEAVLCERGKTILPEPPGPSPAWLRIVVPGTDNAPPVFGEGNAVYEQPGPNEVQIDLDVKPFGTVVVRIPTEVLKDAGGATVRLGARRETTLIAKLAEEARFPNVATGKTAVTIEWSKEGFEPTVRQVEVKADETTTLEIEGPAGE